jgi:putative hydroxymethylpyrimidine transport system substrate-binding protein
MIVIAVAALASAVAAAGCGGSGASEPTTDAPPKLKEIDVTLDGYPGPENIGILIADERGYFFDVGLDVWVRTPQSRLRPLPYVAERAVALAVSHEPQVEMARNKGVPVESIGSLVSGPTAAMIWLKRSKIGGVSDLKGKTVGFVGLPFERNLLETILAGAGLTLDDVELRRFDYDLPPALAGGEVDAILGSWNLEGATLEARGLEPVITRVESLGVPSYDEFVVIARTDRLEEEPRVMRDFMAAVRRGHEAAVADPRAAFDLLAQGDEPAGVVRAEIEATLPLLATEAEAP